MKKNNKFKYLIAIFSICIFTFTSCDTTELNLTDDPSGITPEVANTEFLFNSVQLQFATFFEAVSSVGMDLSRMTQMGGSDTYQNNYASSDFNGIWSFAYANFLKDAELAKEIALEDGHIHVIAAVNIMESYIIMTLADYFGDIPYSEALEGGANPNPNRDTAESVYADVKNLLQNAINTFDETSLPLNSVNDFYYDGNTTKWTKLANSLLIRHALQTKLVNANSWNEINTIVTEGNYITNSSDNFLFNWSSSTAGSDSRHPKFSLGYDQASVSGFMSNYYMWLMHQEKGFDDPRLRYYFYRKSLTIPTNSTFLPCVNFSVPSHYNTTLYPFCNAGDGYIGRDHGDFGSVPADNNYRTIYGIYPVGGKYDDDSNTNNPGSSAGLAGAGISPIMTASFVDFMLAEANISLNNNSSTAKTYLLSGITKSMAEVKTFSPSNMSTTDVNNYKNYVEGIYDVATGSDQLNIIMKEWYIAGFGNGVDSYNNYRRTGYPNNMQPSLSANPGSYMNLLLYPANHVSLNSNAEQRVSVGEKVFWAEPTSFNLDF